MSELPKNWTVAKVGDVISLTPKNDCDDSLEVGFVPMPLMGTGFRDRHGFQARPWSEVKKGYTHFADGDVLVAKITPCFENAKGGIVRNLPNGVGAGSTEFFVCRPIPGAVLSEYLLALFKTNRFLKDGQQVMSGAVGQQRVPKQYLLESELPLAPLNEQKRIADKLDALLARVDSCRERLDRVPVFIKRFRQAVLAAATSGRLTEEWRVATGQVQPWSSKVGSDVFCLVTSGSRGWAEYYSESGALFLRMGNLDHITIELDLAQVQRVRPPAGAEGARTRVQVGDILISITADVGMVGVVRTDLGEAYINQHLCLARQTGEYSSEFLGYFLASPVGGLGQLSGAQRGATKVGLTLGDIRSLVFQIPPLPEQHEIVRRVETLFAYADRLESRYRTARAAIDRLTPALLAKAFRGELVPQDPSDEPASVLLERIRAERESGAKATTKKERPPRKSAPAAHTSPAPKPVEAEVATTPSRADRNGNGVQTDLFGGERPAREPRRTEFAELPVEQVMATFRAVVRGAGEISEVELLRQAARRLGHERLVQSIREPLEKHLKTALRRKIVAREGEGYIAATPTIARYEDEFLLKSLLSVMRKGYEYEREDAMGMVVEYLGYAALTEAMGERMKGVITKGIREKEIGHRGRWIWKE